jgi:hypothetical protein
MDCSTKKRRENEESKNKDKKIIIKIKMLNKTGKINKINQFTESSAEGERFVMLT